MIYDSRTDTVKLHHKDKVYLAGALGVINALARCEPTSRRRAEYEEMGNCLGNAMDLLGVAGDEHLKRADKEPEPAKQPRTAAEVAQQKRLDPTDNGVDPPY